MPRKKAREPEPNAVSALSEVAPGLIPAMTAKIKGVNRNWSGANALAIKQATEVLTDTCHGIVAAGLRFQDLNPDAEEPPEAWIAELGEQEAWRQFRLAMAAWRSGSRAPYGLTMAKDIAVADLKAKAQAGTGADRPLGIAIQININTAQDFPEREVEG